MIELYERQYVELQDVQLTQQWLLAARAVGYQFPAVIHTESSLADAGQQCPTSNIDIFVVSSKQDFPLLPLLLRSIDAFMPCRGHMHVVVDPADVGIARAWVDLNNPKVHLHELQLPKKLARIPGYLAQQWIMLWADRLAASVGSAADYLMYIDTDSALGLPVTCTSLFDEQGRVYLGGFPPYMQIMWQRSVQDFLGMNMTASYM